MTELHDRYYRTLKTLDTFVDRALELKPYSNTLSGFHYDLPLLKSAMTNTYVETVSSLADSLHLAIKQIPSSNIYWAYYNTVSVLSPRFNLSGRDVILAFDSTDEEFYGDPQGFWIHKYTGENGVRGKFKFLTCAIVNSDIPERIPLISVPIRVGQNMAKEVMWMLSIIRPLVHSISLCLFDRGFYSKELMLTLSNASTPSLIFVPKTKQIKRELEQMVDQEKKKINYQFELNKEKTILRGETTLVFLKQ
ncbi:MAG: hypothetical protein QXD64_02335, partial [Thermoplasmata archaeon]